MKMGHSFLVCLFVGSRTQSRMLARQNSVENIFLHNKTNARNSAILCGFYRGKNGKKWGQKINTPGRALWPADRRIARCVAYGTAMTVVQKTLADMLSAASAWGECVG